MPTWPTTLPQQPILNTIRLGSPKNSIVRTSMDVGRDKVRRRSSGGVRELTMTFGPMTDAQYLIFENFHQVSTSMGALAFDITHPISDQIVSVMFRGEENHFSLSTPSRDGYKLTLNLEILP